MNFVTTNIRFPEDVYMRLREEAARKRMSLSAVVRERVGAQTTRRTAADVRRITSALDAEAKKLGAKLKNFDASAAIRRMREEGR